jgi:hypothetical protein
MKKLMTLMLGLSLLAGSTVAFAQGTDTTATKKAKKSKKSKKTDATSTEKKS